MQIVRQSTSKPWGSIRGITVLELMIGLAALGIVILVAVPGSTLLLDKYRMKVTSDSIITGLELARTESSARSAEVILCPSSNGHTCRKDGDWSHGWLVFSDGNGNGSVQDIELIRSFDAPSEKIHITTDGALKDRAAFTATGLVGDEGVGSGQFQICLRDGKASAILVTVDADGWVQKMPAPDQSCLNS
jgi:type IV fimbrial biogenesis protein FimT